MKKLGECNMKIFDPRINKKIESDNPALIFADILVNEKEELRQDPKFWNLIKDLANYCEELNNERNL